MNLPEYKCHKKVRAFRIAAIDMLADGGAYLIPERQYLSPLKVKAEYMKKHAPAIGGYYLLYADNYESFSPAKAFEDGYAEIGETSDGSPERQARLDRAHLKALPILVEFVKNVQTNSALSLLGRPGNDLRDQAAETLAKWDKARDKL